MELVHPDARPVLVFDDTEPDPLRREIGHELGQHVHQAGAIACRLEQRRHRDLRPHRRLAGRGLEDRMVLGVEQRDRERAEIFQRGVDFRLLAGGNDQREFEPGHGRRARLSGTSLSFRRRTTSRPPSPCACGR